MTMIGDRPAVVADRAEAGHWEGDLITGASNRSAIGTLVERTSRYVLLLHLPIRHTADATRDGILHVMRELPAELRRSLTWDQGKEMAGHLEITAATGMSVYFCEPHSPWQRGSNENTVNVWGAAFGLIGQAGAGSKRRLSRILATPRCAFRLTCPLNCRHRPGPLVLA
jgi:IS30 family transposase